MVTAKTRLTLMPTTVSVGNGYFSVRSSGIGWSMEEDIELPQIHLIEITNGIFLSQLRITFGVEEREIHVNKLRRVDAHLLKEAIENGQQRGKKIVDL